MMKTWRFLLPAVPPEFILLLAVITAADGAWPQVVINEVYYDHPGSDAGFEFVELRCLAEAEICLDGWSIAMIDGRTGDVRELWQAGSGRMIESGGLLLIGGDSCGVSAADLLTGSIENGPDAVVLLRGIDEIDLVRFGGDDPGCPAGRSLSRLPDGTGLFDDCSGLICALPTPGRRNFHDIDLSVSPAGPFHVHCMSGPSDIPVLLENRGIERFSGTSVLTVSSVRPGSRTVVGVRRVSLTFDEGEDLVVIVSCAGLPSGISTIELLIEAGGDTNPENDRESVSVSSSPGEVVITEIMYRPDRGGEWIELFNRSAGTVDLSGWSVTDRSGASGKMSGGVWLGAGCFLVIAQDPGEFFAAYPYFTGNVSALESGWPRLNDGDGRGTAEEIFIRRRDGTVMESVAYGSMIVDERGRSIERLSPAMCSSGAGGIWLRCGGDRGATPGVRNYCHSDIIPEKGMNVSPDPFCPELDGEARFVAAAGPGEVSYGARLFDMEGREIARLASGPVGAPAVSFSWDGRGPDGREAGTGLYICVVEFMGSGGGVCRREKGTVAVWAGRR